MGVWGYIRALPIAPDECQLRVTPHVIVGRGGGMLVWWYAGGAGAGCVRGVRGVRVVRARTHARARERKREKKREEEV